MDTLQETRLKTRRRKIDASVIIQRVIRGFVQRRRFGRLVRKVNSMKRIESAMQSKDIEELLRAVRDASTYVKPKEELKSNKKRRTSQFSATKMRVENDLREKLERAEKLVKQLQNADSRRRSDTIDAELKSWKNAYVPSPTHRKNRMNRMKRRKRRGKETMNDFYETLNSESTTTFVMILIVSNLILVRCHFFLYTDTHMISLTTQ